MAELGFEFNGPTEEPENDFDLIPPGKYMAQIVDTEVKGTAAGTGKILAVQWEIMEGRHERRRVFQNINYENASAGAQEIGQKQLGQITWALGIQRLRDTNDLHFKPALITVKIGKMDPQYGQKNEISFVAAYSGGTGQQQQQPRPAARQQQPAQTQQPATANASGRPWPSRR